MGAEDWVGAGGGVLSVRFSPEFPEDSRSGDITGCMAAVAFVL